MPICANHNNIDGSLLMWFTFACSLVEPGNEFSAGCFDLETAMWLPWFHCDRFSCRGQLSDPTGSSVNVWVRAGSVPIHAHIMAGRL